MNSKRILQGIITGFIISALIVFSSEKALPQSDDFIELAESVPTETSLESSGLSRTSDVWLKMINEANQSIDIETFYFAGQQGEPLDTILTALKAAAGRSVKIRIIVDSSFYSKNDKTVDELSGISNIEIKKIPLGNLAGGVMHAKYFITDNLNVFTGSQNMDWRALKHIHEIGIRIRSRELARTFTELFETDWKLCDNNFYGLTNTAVNFFVNEDNPAEINSARYGKVICYPAFSPVKLNMQGLSSEEDELIKIIGNTKEKLFIQMYSYSPKANNESKFYDRIDQALRDAASRKVDIRIIFSDWSIREGATEFIKSLSQVDNIKIKFSSVPEYSSGFIPYSRVEHCKYFVSDDNVSWISSANWEWSYFNNCRNVTLIIDNSELNKDLKGVFFRSWNSSFVNDVDINKEYKPVKRN